MKHYIFKIGNYITFNIEAANLKEAYQKLKKLGFDKSGVKRVK